MKSGEIQKHMMQLFTYLNHVHSHSMTTLLYRAIT